MDNVLQDKKTIVPKMLLAVACKQRESFLYQKKKHAKDELDGIIFFLSNIPRPNCISSVVLCNLFRRVHNFLDGGVTNTLKISL